MTRLTMSRGSRFAVPLAATLLVIGGLNVAATGKAKAVTCIRHVYVTFFVYSTMAAPSSNTCWSYERPAQANWYFVRTDGYTAGDPNNFRWYYDDTSTDHDLTTDTNRILQAASGRSYGYELMAYRNSAWRKLNPNNVVTRFWAELYSGENQVRDLYSVWTANPSIGRPVTNIGHLTDSATQTEVKNLCQEVSSGTYIGFYSSTAISSTKLSAISAGLNDCTS